MRVAHSRIGASVGKVPTVRGKWELGRVCRVRDERLTSNLNHQLQRRQKQGPSPKWSIALRPTTIASERQHPLRRIKLSVSCAWLWCRRRSAPHRPAQRRLEERPAARRPSRADAFKCRSPRRCAARASRPALPACSRLPWRV